MVLYVFRGELTDAGRFTQTKLETDRGAFRTPSLRNLAVSVPRVGAPLRTQVTNQRANGLGTRSLLTRATAFSARKDWGKAEDDCRAALRIHPLHPQARLMLGICLHNQGNPDAGRREVETAIGLATHPRQKTAFREWYQSETR